MMKRLLSIAAALMLLFSLAAAETTDTPVVTVNGEALMYSTYASIESAYLYQYEAAGVDLTDAATLTYLQDLAMTYAIEQMLVEQDMRAQGCYEFDEETEAWFVQTGKATYAAELAAVKDVFRSETTTEDEVEVYALAYAEALGVTEQTYIDFYRTQYAQANYFAWLTRDVPVTEEDVQAAYTTRVEASKALYAEDAAAFETALNSGDEAWYRPEGYRSVLQILLPAEGDTAEARLQSVQPTVDAILTRLQDGESFQNLVIEYGADVNLQNDDFLSVGYQVHPDSAVWEDAFIAAAFSADMAQPGCWSQPLVSDLGVHILYYLNDVPGGPIELTTELHDALSYVIYSERCTAAQTARINELAEAAEIVFH